MNDFEMVLQVVTDDGTRIRRRLEVDIAMLTDDEDDERIDQALAGFADEISAALGGAKGDDAIRRLQSVRLTLDRLP